MSEKLRLAMLGMIPGNGHPWSWSALINGYDTVRMAECPYPVIPTYLATRPNEPMTDACVTHIWTDDPADAPEVAAAVRIEHIVSAPEDVIGHVDGVIISADDGNDHVRRARPFVEAGLPVFVDKPLATNLEDLRQFSDWVAGGSRILSSSGMRYAPELEQLAGNWRWVAAFTPKSWERYGIHLLEPAARILGLGFENVRLTATGASSVAHITHCSGAILTLTAMDGAAGGAFTFHAHGEKDYRSVTLTDTCTAFRRQLKSVIAWMREGTEPHTFSETQELMAVLIAGIQSRENDGRPVEVAAVLRQLES